jgi:hypothetical protein
VRVELVRRWAIAAAMVFGVACGSSPSASCPMVPETCPSPVPSYATDVAPIIQQRCATAACHSPTGAQSIRPYQTYDEVKKFQIDILIEVRACAMPKAPAPPLTTEELATFVGWLYCDAPNN